MNSQLGIGIYVHSYEYQHENNFTWSSFKILNLFQLFELIQRFLWYYDWFHYLTSSGVSCNGCLWLLKSEKLVEAARLVKIANTTVEVALVVWRILNTLPSRKIKVIHAALFYVTRSFMHQHKEYQHFTFVRFARSLIINSNAENIAWSEPKIYARRNFVPAFQSVKRRWTKRCPQ